jgi:hypothetical protein
MRIKTACQFVLPVLMAAVASGLAAQPAGASESPANSAIVGVWRAQMDGLPAMTLNVTDETGRLSGAVLFYLLRRNPGEAQTSSPGVPEPLIDPKFDGTTLTFAVSHRRAHPPASLNSPPVSFRVRVMGPGKGELVNETESSPVIVILKDAE